MGSDLNPVLLLINKKKHQVFFTKITHLVWKDDLIAGKALARADEEHK